MVAPRPVALVGLPGVGKSSIGRRASKLLGFTFADTDRLVEERAGCSIAELFQSAGEERFRALEHALLEQLLQPDADARCVIATGGGAVLDPRSRSRLADRATTIYLHAAPETLLRRVGSDRKRPLLTGADLRTTMQTLYQVRDPLYRAAAVHTIDAEGSNASALATIVASLVAGADAVR